MIFEGLALCLTLCYHFMQELFFVTQVTYYLVIRSIVLRNTVDNIEPNNGNQHGQQVKAVGDNACNISRIDGINHPRENNKNGKIPNHSRFPQKEGNGGNAHGEDGKYIKGSLVCKNT